jgi:hypothetical protein
MYMHGGIISAAYTDPTVDAFGYVPGRSDRIQSAQAWVAELNAWGGQQVQVRSGQLCAPRQSPA